MLVDTGEVAEHTDDLWGSFAPSCLSLRGRIMQKAQAGPFTRTPLYTCIGCLAKFLHETEEKKRLHTS